MSADTSQTGLSDSIRSRSGAPRVRSATFTSGQRAPHGMAAPTNVPPPPRSKPMDALSRSQTANRSNSDLAAALAAVQAEMKTLSSGSSGAQPADQSGACDAPKAAPSVPKRLSVPSSVPSSGTRTPTSAGPPSIGSVKVPERRAKSPNPPSATSSAPPSAEPSPQRNLPVRSGGPSVLESSVVLRESESNNSSPAKSNASSTPAASLTTDGPLKSSPPRPNRPRAATLGSAPPPPVNRPSADAPGVPHSRSSRATSLENTLRGSNETQPPPAAAAAPPDARRSTPPPPPLQLVPPEESAASKVPASDNTATPASPPPSLATSFSQLPAALDNVARQPQQGNAMTSPATTPVVGSQPPPNTPRWPMQNSAPQTPPSGPNAQSLPPSVVILGSDGVGGIRSDPSSTQGSLTTTPLHRGQQPPPNTPQMRVMHSLNAIDPTPSIAVTTEQSAADGLQQLQTAPLRFISVITTTDDPATKAPTVFRLSLRGELERVTIAAIKEALSEFTGLQPSQQVLTKDGVVLVDSWTGKEVALQGGAVLYLQTDAPQKISPSRTSRSNGESPNGVARNDDTIVTNYPPAPQSTPAAGPHPSPFNLADEADPLANYGAPEGTTATASHEHRAPASSNTADPARINPNAYDGQLFSPNAFAELSQSARLDTMIALRNRIAEQQAALAEMERIHHRGAPRSRSPGSGGYVGLVDDHVDVRAMAAGTSSGRRPLVSSGGYRSYASDVSYQSDANRSNVDSSVLSTGTPSRSSRRKPPSEVIRSGSPSASTHSRRTLRPDAAIGSDTMSSRYGGMSSPFRLTSPQH